jgi:cytoskeletal protein RodZ
MRVVAFNLKLIKSSLLAASIAFVFGYALGAANWLKTRPSIEERTTKIERIEAGASVSPNSQDVASTTSATSSPPVPAAAAPDAPALEEPSTSQTASTPPPLPTAAAPIAVAAPETMPLEKDSWRPPLPRAAPRRVAQKSVGTGLPGNSFRRSTPEQLPGSRAPSRGPNPQRMRQ